MERIDAAQALMPALLPEEAGRIGYIDGHMIPYWARVSMHKGKIAMLGRIMAGSQAVIAHDENGQALRVEYYPPDMRLSHIIEGYCGKLYEASGMELFVIDREVNSLATACAFEARKWGLLSMLDSNEYKGLSSFDATPIGELEDGSCVYEGRWAKARKEDPRIFVLVEQANGRVLVYWGTSKVKESLEMIEWPTVYRQRNEIQENSFKGMIDHGALNTNYGRKKIIGPDRHQQRARKKLEKSLNGTCEKLEKKGNQVKEQQEKVSESEQKGHGKRLEQRQRALVIQEEKLKEAQQQEKNIREQIEDLGILGERADRDFRKQTIMTFRTLFMENALTSFMALLWAKTPEKVSLESLLDLFFHRSGSRLETDTEVIYWVNTTGLSVSRQRILKEIVEGLCAMDLKCQGKPIRVCLREMPP
jgi:hypothetical protein